MAQPIFYNTETWIQANKEHFSPPVCNKMMHNNQLKVFFVGGPNIRKDYHIEQGEEVFYMRKGDMILRTVNQGKMVDVPIKEGEVFLLPARVPHSPQRIKDTLGMVIERERKPEEQDCLRWYVEGNTDVLYERWMNLKDLGKEIAITINDFFKSGQFKTGQPIPGTITDKPPFQPNDKCTLMKPFSLHEWLQKNKTEIHEKGYKKMFPDECQTKVNVYGPGQYDSFTCLCEAFVWQLEGHRVFTIGGKQYRIGPDDTLLIPPDVSFQSHGSNDCLTLIVEMVPSKTVPI